MRRTLAALGAALLCAPPAYGQVEASEAWLTRQNDLVLLASELGRLHRLRQVCYAEEQPDLFRRRLMALIPLEMPMGTTRLEMINAFNDGYREASSEHAICGREARAAYAAEAEAALEITERLYAPFR